MSWWCCRVNMPQQVQLWHRIMIFTSSNIGARPSKCVQTNGQNPKWLTSHLVQTKCEGCVSWLFYDCGSGVEPASCHRKVAGSIPLVCMSKCPWSCMAVATTISVWMHELSCFGQKCLINALKCKCFVFFFVLFFFISEEYMILNK